METKTLETVNCTIMSGIPEKGKLTNYDSMLSCHLEVLFYTYQKRLLDWFRARSDDKMKNRSQVHAHIDIDSRVMMATSCRQFEKC